MPQIPQISVLNLPSIPSILMPTMPIMPTSTIPTIPVLYYDPTSAVLQPSMSMIELDQERTAVQKEAARKEAATTDVTSNCEQPALPASSNDRKQKIARWLEKRKRRTWAKRGTKANTNRKAVAMKRRRVEGRFAKKSSWVSCA